MGWRRNPRRRPLAPRRSLQRAVSFQDPEAEALVQGYLTSLGRAHGGALDEATQHELRRAIADRTARLAPAHLGLSPRALVLKALNSYARPTDAAATLAEARLARPKEPLWRVVLGALVQTLWTACSMGIGWIPRVILLVIMFIANFFGRLRAARPPEPVAAVAQAIPAPAAAAAAAAAAVGAARPPVRVPVLDADAARGLAPEVLVARR